MCVPRSIRAARISLQEDWGDRQTRSWHESLKEPRSDPRCPRQGRKYQNGDQSTPNHRPGAQKLQQLASTRTWQQLAIAGILIGAVMHWYFAACGPETEAAEHLLYLKNGSDHKPAKAHFKSGQYTENPELRAIAQAQSRLESMQDQKRNRAECLIIYMQPLFMTRT